MEMTDETLAACSSWSLSGLNVELLLTVMSPMNNTLACLFSFSSWAGKGTARACATLTDDFMNAETQTALDPVVTVTMPHLTSMR